MRRLIIACAGVLALSLAACSKYQIPTPPCPEGSTGVSFQNDVQPIFNAKCISCHSGNQAPDLSDGWAYEELVDGGYLDTEFPCESSLYDVFSGTHDGRVTDEELLVILGWIQEGAPEN